MSDEEDDYDPVFIRRRQRQAKTRLRLTALAIGGGLLLAVGMIVFVGSIASKRRAAHERQAAEATTQRSPADATAPRHPAEETPRTTAPRRPAEETPRKQENVATDFDSGPEEMLRWAASVRNESIRIQTSRPGNAYAEKEADDNWTKAMLKPVGRQVKWKVRIYSVEAGPVARLVSDVLIDSPKYRFILMPSGPPSPEQLVLDVGYPVRVAAGNENWLKSASSGSPAILDGQITSCLYEEHAWIELIGSGLRTDVITKGREMRIRVALKDATVSKP